VALAFPAGAMAGAGDHASGGGKTFGNEQFGFAASGSALSNDANGAMNYQIGDTFTAHARVTCLIVSPGPGTSQGAIVGGTITHSSNPGLVGGTLAFNVADNGEPGADPNNPDGFAAAAVPPTTDACNDVFTAPTFAGTVETGNITVLNR
jgi:hypothetical protein